jgi:hypothetical protein
MSDRYNFELEVDQDEGEAIVEVEDTGEGSMFSGYVDLYYQGREAPKELPVLIDSKRVAHIGWDGVDADVPNLADGETLRYDVPDEYANGSGKWLLYVGVEDEPTIEITAPAARKSDETEPVNDTPEDELKRELTTEKNRNRERERRAQEVTNELEDKKGDVPERRGIYAEIQELLSRLFDADKPE